PAADAAAVAVEPARHRLAVEPLLLDRLVDEGGLVVGRRLEAGLAAVVEAQALDVAGAHDDRRGPIAVHGQEEGGAPGEEVDERCAEPAHQSIATSDLPATCQSGVGVTVAVPARSETSA